MNAPASATNAGEWSIGQTLLDDYKVERVLGEGGMGKVYLLKSKTTGMQFAVKRAKGLSDADRCNCLAELQTWIDLPEHPNLVPCRFFRTVGDEVLIFAQYVAGGSLKDWIDSGKLYEGGKVKALERILDTVIQSAWGLHCLHELGLVHQDVKPSNVMMGTDAQVAVKGLKAMISDYGLARARAAGGDRHEPDRGRSILVSSGGYTPAYCSPEQFSGGKADRRNDIWSWGLSVLEMFQGGVSWYSGRVALATLEAFLEHNGEDDRIPAMPVVLADALKNCFHEDPARRYQKLDVLLNWLPNLYLANVGTLYRHTLDKIEKRTALHREEGRRTREGSTWSDPIVWLKQALAWDGRDPSEAAEIVARLASSRRGQLVADIAAYDEARRMYERLIKGGNYVLENNLARLCKEAAFVHETADDNLGAVAMYDRAIEIRERLVNVGGRRDVADDLAELYSNKAVAVSNLGDEQAAVALYDQAIEIRERLVAVEGRRELSDGLAVLYMNKANSVCKLGDNRAAVALYDRAIEIRERLVNVEGRRELSDGLAVLYMNKANAVSRLGDNRAAVALYDRAIKITERLVNVEGESELVYDLSNLYQNKANAVSKLGENDVSVILYDRAIEIRERLVNVEGRRELASGLADLYQNKGASVKDLGDNRAAVALYDRAIEIRERLVNVEGRRELANDLASIYMNKAIAVSALGDKRAAVALYDRAIEIRERLVNVEGRSELENDLASLYMNKATYVYSTGDNRAAVALYDQAIKIRERLVNVDGRSELATDLAILYIGNAKAYSDLGDKHASLALYNRAVKFMEQLVKVEGRSELGANLARVKAYRGLTMIRFGETEEGKRETRDAMSVLRAEVERTGRTDLKAALDWIAKQFREQ